MAHGVYRYKSRQRFAIRRKVPCSSGIGSYTEDTGRYVECDVMIELDLDKIARDIGRKAITNKTGKSAEASGAIVAKRLGIRPVLVEESASG